MRIFDFADKVIIGFAVVCVLCVFIVCASDIGYRIDKGAGEERIVTATVTDKGIKAGKDKEQKYLVYTKTNEGIEVFEITDSLIAGRFNSSDIYAGIEIGKTYSFTVRGSRDEFWSRYPNIYEYKEVDQEDDLK